MKRWLRISAIILVVLAVGAFAAKRFLGSRLVRDQVVSKIEALYGGTVKIASLDVGVNNTTVNGVELYEKAGATEPWLTVRDLQTDISLLMLVRGQANPDFVKLQGATVLLRFDRQGNLATSLPSPQSDGDSRIDAEMLRTVPEIAVENSSVILRKEGSRDIVLSNVHGRLTKNQGKLSLTGGLDNAELGAWLIEGTFRANSGVNVSLKSVGKVPVTQEMLERLPFVPAAVWREVQVPQGKTSAVVQVRYDLDEKKIHYRVELEPENTQIAIAITSLEANIARGTVTIDDGLVKLADLEAKAFMGTVRTTADLDFRRPASRLHFERIDADGLDVGLFPPSWRFPGQLHGKLRGSAKLDVSVTPGTITPAAAAGMVGSITPPLDASVLPLAALVQVIPPESKIHTEGRGRAVILDAKVGGQPAAPIELQLRAVPGGFRFSGMDEPERPAPPARKEPSSQSQRALPALADGLLAALFTAVQDKSATVIQKSKASYLEVNVKMDDVDLGRFESDMNVKLPFALAGRLSFQVKVAIPLDESRDLRKYKLHGSVRLDKFLLSELRLDAVEAQVDLDDGVLRLSKLTGTMPGQPAEDPGTFAGDGSFRLEPLGDLEFKGKVSHIPLSRLAKLAGLGEPMAGDLSGSLQATVPGKTLTDSSTWKATAQLSSQLVAAFGLKLTDARAGLELAKGDLSLADFHALLEGAPVNAVAKVRLAGAFPADGKLKVRAANLSMLDRLAPALRLPIAVSGELKTDIGVAGTLAPFKMKVSGQTQVADLKIDRVAAKDVTFAWDIDDLGLRLRDVQAQLYGGEVTGSATVPFRAEAPGSLKLELKDLDAAALIKDVPGVPVKVDGKVSGQLLGTLPTAKAKEERSLSVQLEIKAPKLRVQNIATEQLKGSVDYHQGTINYRLEGRSLGGTFELEGQLPPAGADKEKIKKGHLRINSVRIHRLLQALGAGEEAGHFGGSISVAVDSAHSPTGGWPTGAGKVRLNDLRYQDTRLAADASADLVLSGTKLRMREFSTEFGQGTVRGQLAVDLAHPQHSFLSLDIDNVEVGQVLKPWLGDKVQGGMQARIRLKLGAEWSGSADVEIGRGKLAGLEITQWRLPLTFRYSPGEGRGRLQVADLQAQVGRGRLGGKFTFAWDHVSRLEGQLQLTRADLRTLLRQTIGHADIGVGMLSARVDFAGTDMRSLDDLSANVVASFEQTQALSLPVLKQLGPFLGIGSNLTFNKGDLRGRLDRGIFRIERVALEAPNAQLFIDGHVTLKGRLDLDVIAQLGNLGVGTPRLRMLGLKVPIAGPVPVGVVQEAASLLANRVIELQVTGTVQSPTIRVLPLATLRQEAVRFLLTRRFATLPVTP